MRQRVQQPVAPEGYADAIGAMGEDPPVVIGLLGLGEAQRQHGLELLLAFILAHIEGGIAVLPQTGTEQRDLAVLQHRQ